YEPVQDTQQDATNSCRTCDSRSCGIGTVDFMEIQPCAVRFQRQDVKLIRLCNLLLQIQLIESVSVCGIPENFFLQSFFGQDRIEIKHVSLNRSGNSAGHKLHDMLCSQICVGNCLHDVLYL